MSFKKYNIKNNAICALNLPLADTDVTMVLKGNFDRLPTSNFIVKLTKKVSGVVTARENIYVTTRSGSTCTGLVRAYEPVPISDSATTQIQQALSFAVDDVVENIPSYEFFRDLIEGPTEIPDMRAVAVGNPNSYLGQKFFTYEFRPATGADAGNLGITGSVSAWFCLETISAWVGGGGLADWNYVTQLAWSVHSSTFELYTRKATSNTTWGAWKKQLPGDGLSLDYSLVPAYGIMAIYDYIPYTQFSGGANKKITKEGLELNFVKDWCTGSSSSQSNPSTYGYLSSTVAVPKGGICTAGIHGIYNSGSAHPNPSVQWSADGSTGWTNILVLVPGNVGSPVGSCFAKPGYVRMTSNGNNGYNAGYFFTVQQF